MNPAEAEAWLGSLESIGMRFGLERMHALCTALGMPQNRFASAHVVGTNGKSSTTEMAVRLLAVSGLSAGGCISPHADSWSERVLIGTGRLDPAEFAVAVERVAETVPAVERRLPEDERVTQFEAAVAATFVALARAKVEVAVIEAGLGGRLDATNVIPSKLTALTSVGLDHTELLGPTTLDVAREKLAVLRPHTTLIAGRLDSEIEELTGSVAAQRHCTILRPESLGDEAAPAHFTPYLRRNGALAVTIAEQMGGGRLDAASVRATLADVPLAGRAELVAGEPPLILDAAHNAEGAAALAESLPSLAGGRPITACLSILAEKDHAAIAAELAPLLELAVCTCADPPAGRGRPGAKALPAAELGAAMRATGAVKVEIEPDPERAAARAKALAQASRGVALFAGSHYLLRYAWTPRHAQNFFR